MLRCDVSLYSVSRNLLKIICARLPVALARSAPVYALAAVVLSLQPGGLFADEFIDDRVKQVRLEVEREQVAIRELERQQAALEVDLKKQAAAAEELKREEAALLAELQQVRASEARVAAEIERISLEARELRAKTRGRLKAIYMKRSRGLGAQLFFQVTNSRFARHAYYAARVHRHDSDLLKKMAALLSERELARAELTGILSEKEKVASALATRRRRSLDLVSKQRSLAATLKKNREQRETKVLSLQAQALRLETVVSSLTGGGAGGGYTRQRRRKAGPADGAVAGVYQGPGLKNLKGSLIMPVDGTVVSRYGKQSGKSFSSIVFRRGIEFEAARGAKVEAIAKGRILHLGRMPGYGTIIIIDHGRRYYSLYGRLGRTLVEKGVEVARGTPIATVEDAEGEGPGLHFEIRKDGKPVDPQGFYRSKL